MANLLRIIKRTGEVVPFDQTKITNAIYKAAAAVGGHDRELSQRLSAEVVSLIERNGDTPSVEEIQDLVEKVLIEHGHARTAKAYILYRQERARLRQRQRDRRGRGSEVPWQTMWRTLVWNLDHQCHTVEALNTHVRGGTFPDLVMAAEEAYEAQLRAAAALVLESRARVRLVIVAGPSTSGKTTATAKLTETLGEAGLRVVPMNLDNYFFDLHLHPRDAHGDYDFETPEALDLALIDSHIKDLIDGRAVKMPRYDFVQGRRLEGSTEISIKPSQVILIDTLHGLYKPMTRSVPDEMKFKVYIETISELRDHDGKFVRWTDIRLLRRMVRDHAQRGYDPAQTIGHWHYVRRSELKHIIPFIRDADYIVNGGLPYELPYHRKYSFKHFPDFIASWKNDPKRQDACIRAERIHSLLAEVESYDDESVLPGDSLLREFIGGSIYKLH